MIVVWQDTNYHVEQIINTTHSKRNINLLVTNHRAVPTVYQIIFQYRQQPMSSIGSPWCGTDSAWPGASHMAHV